jgi:hypothetical protein
MSLKRLYLLWFIALIPSIGLGVLAYSVSMLIMYGSVHGKESFDGLISFIGSLILIVFISGPLSAALVYLSTRRGEFSKNAPLINNLLYFHTATATGAITTFYYAWVYLNILGLLLFLSLPFFAHRASHKKTRKQAWVIFIISLLMIVGLGALQFYYIVTSDPFRP